MNTQLAPVRRVSLQPQQNIVGIQPQSFGELVQFAEMLKDTTFVPKEYKGKTGDILAAVQFGAELGMPAMQALQSICVINGKPSVYGDATLALCEASGKMVDFREWFDFDEKQQPICAWCEVQRKGRQPKKTSFSVADAQKAKLWGKEGPWTQYPSRMLQMRARAFALRDAFPDVLKGIAIREEAQDYIDVDVTTGEIQEVAAPSTEGTGLDEVIQKRNLPADSSFLCTIATKYFKRPIAARGAMSLEEEESLARKIAACTDDKLASWVKSYEEAQERARQRAQAAPSTEEPNPFEEIAEATYQPKTKTAQAAGN